MKQKIGTILSGSLAEGFLMRFACHMNLNMVKTGKFVSITVSNGTFFSMITDLKLEVSHPDILLFPPAASDFFLREILKINALYATALLRPLLMINDVGSKMPVKTVPSHFADVYEVDDTDIARVFGDPLDPSKRYFVVGKPIDMSASVCLDLDAFTERSNGIFGKTGTGKTFLTRLVLAGLIKNNKAVNLVFDMHSEYGLQARKEGTGESFVKGLKTLFPDKVVIFSIDPFSTKRRGSAPDAVLNISYQSIQVQDVLSLHQELNLHATACEAAYLVVAKYKQNWLQELLSHGEDIKEFAATVGAHPESLAALYRKLKPIEKLSFFIADGSYNAIDHMMQYLDKGISVIIEFGNYSSTFCYLLLTNIITRRIHELYTQKTELFLGSQRAADEPKKLMITIEEAHKFLNPQTARQTIFGTIAREMRKYYVSLLVVDQRPSGIDDEVLSQFGTKIIAQLNDEKDIAAALTGVSNNMQLRTILASLDTKKQVLMLGHAIAMPVVIETRSYDASFYADMQGVIHKNIEQLAQELF